MTRMLANARVAEIRLQATSWSIELERSEEGEHCTFQIASDSDVSCDDARFVNLEADATLVIAKLHGLVGRTVVRVEALGLRHYRIVFDAAVLEVRETGNEDSAMIVAEIPAGAWLLGD